MASPTQSNTGDDERNSDPASRYSQSKELMEEAVGKRRRNGSIRVSRVSSQRGSLEREHGSTLLLITPRAGLLPAHLDYTVESDGVRIRA
jgi:hypothetical protein